MRAPLAACLVLLLAAGCLEGGQAPPGGTPSASPTPTAGPTPTPSAPPSATVTSGEWTMEVRPGGFSGRFGDEARFEVVLRKAGAPVDAYVSAESRFVHLGNGSSFDFHRVHAGVVNFSGTLLVGKAPNLTLFVRPASDAGPEGGVWLRGPEVHALPGGAEVAPAARSDAWDAGPNLTVRVEGRRVVATYAAEHNATNTCAQAIRPMGNWTLREGETPRVLVGLVADAHNDACVEVPRTRTSVTATTPELPPGPVRVRVIVFPECFCPPNMPWKVVETDVQVT